MTRKTKGPRSRTRKKLKKGVSEKTTANQFLENFEQGEKVLVKIEPSSHRGMPNPKFKGKTGVVVGERGKAYIVEVGDGDSKKKIITFPEHLKHRKQEDIDGNLENKNFQVFKMEVGDVF